MTATSITVNGRKVDAVVEPRLNLADFVRDQCHLTGTHVGCEHGVCGACTLLVDGRPSRSCIVFAVACDGAQVSTIEGLQDDPVMAALRQAFKAEHALQCGYCTPGMLVTARDIVLRLPDADEERIRLELSGNLCRCTGYAGIVKAIQRVLAERPAMPPEVAPTPLPSVRFDDVRRVAPVSPPISSAATGGTEPGDMMRQTLQLAVARAAVWRALKEPSLIAACIPGAELTDVQGGHLTGRIAFALGPIQAHFTGIADVSYDDSTYAGTIGGNGQDRATGTRLTASGQFKLTALGPATTTLELTLDYGLRGALAQFSRPAIVHVFAAEIGAQVARNLENRLLGRTPDHAAPARLGVGRLLFNVLWGKLKNILGGRPET